MIKQSVVPIEFAGGVGDVILCEYECGISYHDVGIHTTTWLADR